MSTAISAVLISFKPSLGAKLAKRAQWAKQRARFGAAVKIFKANAAEYFGHRKSTGGFCRRQKTDEGNHSNESFNIEQIPGVFRRGH